MKTHPLLGRGAASITPIRRGGVTGRVGEFGLTRVGFDGLPKHHNGIDLVAVEFWPVFAAHAGVVVRAGWQDATDPSVGFGQRVRVEAEGIATVYAHLSRIAPEIVVGALVKEGQVLGLTGRTGNIGSDRSIPTHLHFEVHVDGEAVDPAEWLVG